MNSSRGGSWDELSVAGHSCRLYEPAGEPARFVVLCLHDEQATPLSEQPHLLRQFDQHHLAAAAPWTGRSWWTDRICPDFDPHRTAEQHLLQGVLPMLERHWSAAPLRIGLFGIGMGGQGALRLAYKHPSRFPAVAALLPALDFQNRLEAGDEILEAMYPDPEAARQDTALLYVHPLNWPRHQFFACDPESPWWDGTDRLRMKLASLGIRFECDLETSGDGSQAAYVQTMTPRAIEFLVAALASEALRVP